jgi:hypothetical protein
MENVDSYLNALSSEVTQWNALWTAEEDPREMLATKWGWTKSKVKRALLTDLNDPRKYSTPFKDWMEKEFHCLFILWRDTKVKATGCNLSKFYESELLRSAEFYQFAAKLQDIRILCCHDGVSVFTLEHDEQALQKAERLRDFLVNLTLTKFGIKPVVKVEPVKTVVN